MKSLLPLLLTALALLPGSARAYTVLAPGELLRMDALIAWEAGQEVLLLSPVVRGGGTLLLPLPEGARLWPTRPEASGWLGLEPKAPETREAGEASGSEEARADGGVIEDGRTLGQGLVPRPTRVTVGDREAPRPADALGTGLSLDAGPPPMAAAGKVLIVPAAGLGEALASLGHRLPDLDAARLLRGAPRVLVAALPRDPVALRVEPIAVGLDSVWPRIPLARDPKARAHPLALRLLAAGPARDLGGMDFAYGLAASGRKGEFEVPVSLLAWLEEKVERPDRGWRTSHLVAGAMDPRKASAAKLEDLRLPPPLGARRAPPKQRPDAPGGPPAVPGLADAESSSDLEGTGAPASESKEGCEGCGSAGGQSRGRLAGLLLLAFLLRRRSRS